ncbi:unnamed protein product [Fusarium graminearum]|uniref:Chromosome 4, complete genome n=1 Tax=Gibberella zeae (strain ATCC MYA-4620 / CBS 123657 / FGSC 9075 / NRRL 31084 / PH-1) TaxID=229533 RepID=I1S9S1_GIBZE|nr:hypothetical protein FGSG_13602 [Fusarium graminearum PH-1]ESU16137.1 hypothetical protein FGSG_13602 [Fusarium graminearum PH-1]CEF83811.1 unnamed protein product [Fusarium graminearum]CZS74337.1 unnamed protein product [Fusarium graminearum]|eukprot:XP_011328179.1 hypothetical protein FGSG_13602 [Fusarium graminearum PH-1]
MVMKDVKDRYTRGRANSEYIDMNDEVKTTKTRQDKTKYCLFFCTASILPVNHVTPRDMSTRKDRDHLIGYVKPAAMMATSFVFGGGSPCFDNHELLKKRNERRFSEIY